jgi:hypothetical protein
MKTAYVLRKSEGPLPIPALIDRIAGITPDCIQTDSPWVVARVLNHLAQGVEFSLAGYPELKNRIFRGTVGRLAFHVFQHKGEMRHATDAVIPGETVAEGDAGEAQARLIAALSAFERAEAVHPHFAYGRLTKSQYAAAHAMHVADHMDDFRLGA